MIEDARRLPEATRPEADRCIIGAATASRCRVFAFQSPHVCGSSVFPTSGCANATLTVVAPAAGLAAQLQAGAIGIAA
jgi:choline dehydrogenase-like flavoprotein